MAATVQAKTLHRLKIATLVGEVLFDPTSTASEKEDEVKDIISSPGFPLKDPQKDANEDERLEMAVGTLAWALIARWSSINYGTKLPIPAGEQPSNEILTAFLSSWSQNLTNILEGYRKSVNDDDVALAEMHVPHLLADGYARYFANESVRALRNIAAGGSLPNEYVTMVKLQEAINALDDGIKSASRSKPLAERTEEEVIRDRIGKFRVVLALTFLLTETLELDGVSLMKELNSANPKIQRLPFKQKVSKPTAYIQPAGSSGKLWDVWKTKEHVNADDGWIGLVQFDGTNYFSQDPNRKGSGPFRSKEAAAEALSR